MDVNILYAGLSAVTGVELITPSEAAARNITSEPIAIDHVFEYTYKPVRPTFQLHLQYPPREWVDLKVKTVTGAITSVYVKKDYTLAQVKEAIEKENESLPAANQRLVFNMKQLSNEETVESIGIEDGDTVEDICDKVSPPSEDGDLEIEKSLPPEIKEVHEYELQPIGIKDKVTMEDTSDDTSSEWININVETITHQDIKIRIRKSYTIAQVKEAIEREDKSLTTARQKLSFNERQLSDEVTVESIGIKDGDTLFLMIRLRGGGGSGDIPIVLDNGFLDSPYNYDFTKKCDDGKVYMRGGEVYSRPYGWYRFAMKVLNKYEDKTWLGERGIRTASTAGEWPVSYHGTSREGAERIASEGYDVNRGRRFLYGRGIYSAPDLSIVERRYAREFSKNGRRYKIVFQNRVNPVNLRRVNGDQYWLVADDSDIRPYGILVKNIREPGSCRIS